MMKRFYLVIFIFFAFASPIRAEGNNCSLLKVDEAIGSHVMSRNSGQDCSTLGESAKDEDNFEKSFSGTNREAAAISVAIEPDSHMQTLKNLSDTKQQDIDQQQQVSHNSEFIYQIDRPKNASGDVVIILHCSGGNEKSLMPFARSIWPRATLVGIRGRIVQKGQRRWYKKITATKFDQKDVNQEAEAFVNFLTKLADENNLDVARSTFIGYSNGANLLAVVLLQQPDLVRRAVLMRSMPVLDKMPRANLGKTSILTLSGQKDHLYSPFAPALSSLLKNNGARVDSHMVAADHMIGNLDKQLITAWIGGGNSDSLSAMSVPGTRSRSNYTDNER